MNETERDERLRGIQERTEAATEGPWTVAGRSWEVVQPAEDDPHRFDIMDLPIANAQERRSDAEFIAAARQDVPWLLDEVTRLDAVVTAVREVHKPMAWDKRFCDHCEPLVPDPRHVFYPCPTVRAMGGA